MCPSEWCRRAIPRFLSLLQVLFSCFGIRHDDGHGHLGAVCILVVAMFRNVWVRSEAVVVHDVRGERVSMRCISRLLSPCLGRIGCSADLSSLREYLRRWLMWMWGGACDIVIPMVVTRHLASHLLSSAEICVLGLTCVDMVRCVSDGCRPQETVSHYSFGP